MIGKRVTKYFPGHRPFKDTVQEYSIKTDKYLVVYDDGDRETMSRTDNPLFDGRLTVRLIRRVDWTC